MRSCCALSALLAAGAIVGTGCGDAAAPDSVSIGHTLVFSPASRPEAPGPVVFRTQDNNFIAFIPDFSDGLTAFLGEVEPVSALCDPSAPITIVPLDVQFMERPNGELGQLTKGDVPIYVYDVATTDFCGGALSDDHISASGSGRVTVNDHAFELPDPNVLPSYGYRLIGKVTLTTGGSANVSGVVKWVTNPSGRTDVHSQLTLTPAR
jgi:hypothetical protein